MIRRKSPFFEVPFGLFGAQSVVESEAKGAADIVAHQVGADAVVVRANKGAEM